MSHHKEQASCWAVGIMTALLAPAAAAQVVGAASLADLSLEQLSEIPVTSVTGRAESLRTAAASIFVITAEDIRRSAATSLPEALRLAPNLQVARVNADTYAISARGFNNPIANKLLVLIDGRTIYSTLFAGVIWDYHDVVLEDVDRIEVISGPGGTLWGANAVNGIINVITKPAAATQGTLVSVTGSEDGGQLSVRWGGRLGEVGSLRLYGLGLDRGHTEDQDGNARPDGSSKRQVGFRADAELAAGRLTVQGDLFEGGSKPGTRASPRIHGGNLLARWDGELGGSGPYRIQAYYDLQARDETVVLRNRGEAYDVQFTHEPRMPTGQQLLWGGGYRSGSDRNDPSPLVLFVPAERSLSWANVFVQHQLTAGPWQVTTGVKAERNSYTGVEWLPSLRASYQHGPQASTWGAISRTVRAPARIDRDFYFPGAAPFVIAGGEGFESEVANVYELGHRGQLQRNLTYSATLYRQQYSGLRAGRGVPAVVDNRIDGHSQGLEAWAQWQPADMARLSLGYLTQRKKLHVVDPPADPSSIPNLGNDPRYQFSLRAQFDLPGRTEADLHLRRVGQLPNPVVPAYTALDARLGWHVRPGVEVSLLAQNLLDRRHHEFEPAASASYLRRRVFLRLVVQL